MRKQNLEQSALDAAQHMRAVEAHIDETIAGIAALNMSLLSIRQSSGVGVATGHEALVHLADATRTIVAARGALAQAHAVLRETQGEVPGLRTTMFGDGVECPPAKTAHAPLKIVA